MRIPAALVTPAAGAVLTADELRELLDYSPADAPSDAVLEAMIVMATDWVERRYGLALLTQTWRVTIRGGYDGERLVSQWARDPLELRPHPISETGFAVSARQDGIWVDVTSRFDLAAGLRPGLLRILPTEVRPDIDDRLEALRVTYQAGYATTAAIPDGLLEAARHMAGFFTSARQSATFAEDGVSEFSADALSIKYGSQTAGMDYLRTAERLLASYAEPVFYSPWSAG